MEWNVDWRPLIHQAFVRFVFVSGAIAVVLFARKHFDTPPYRLSDSVALDGIVSPPHFLTSRLRYRLTMIGYVALMEAHYLLLTLLFPVLGDQLLPGTSAAHWTPGRRTATRRSPRT